MQGNVLSNNWALILGGSSGMGLATAKKLAQNGYNLFVVHRDRRGSMKTVDAAFDEIRAMGVKLEAYNMDALSNEGRQAILNNIADTLHDGKIRVLLHSIALGNLKLAAPKSDPSLPYDDSNLLNEEDVSQTIYNMGTSLLFWVQDIHKRGMFAPDSRVFGLTSEGNQVAWLGYAAVSAAKCALESMARTIAKEFAPHGIRCNILQPGITDTPALRLIPGSESMKEHAIKRNPLGRMTTPEDVAGVVYLLSRDEASFINGALIRVDGGESISG
ncbi:MAG TPA: SDR family oxidoreductase [Oligoflexus sp.]|uniref:SDR family NAD(P)-dependent oxidoreductase n=1 Tax=Oligoflexus sp. TaxID=1971216 RepID=UPI002D803F9D|nr:SDR family oxidoreductase [Oligoflexus sp.]HET9238544.1 SDR family oxidoreductase [Oligoflexus sp.]